MGQTLLPLGPERESAVTFGQAGRRLWPLPSLPERVWGALGDGMIHILINERDGDGFSWGKIRHADRSQGGCHGSVAVAPQAKLNHSYTRPTIYSSSHTSKSPACRKPKVVRLGWMNELWEDLLQDAVLDCLFCLAGQTKRTLYLMNLNSWNFGKDLHSNKKRNVWSFLQIGETWCRIVPRNVYLQHDVKSHTAEVQAEVQQWARPYIPHSSLWLALPQMFRAKILLFETGSNLPQCQDELQRHDSVYVFYG